MKTTLFVDDPLFIEGLKNGSQQAFTYLYDNYSPALYGVLLRFVKDEEPATDLLQDTFLKVWNNRTSYDASKGRLFTWLLTITRNTALDYLKAQRSKPLTYRLSDEKMEFVVTHKFANYACSVESIGVPALLNCLDENQRQCIDLHYFQGYTDRQIAKQMDASLGTTKTRLMRGLRNLKRYLNSELYDCAR